MSRVNHGLTQLAPIPPLLVLCLVFSNKRAWQSASKRLKRWYRGRLRQTMVDSSYRPDWVVPEGKSQVSRRTEVGNHRRRTLDTLLTSGTSTEKPACPAGPDRNCRGLAGTKNEPHWYFVPDQKKGSKIDPHVSIPKSRWFQFRGVQVHP